MKRNTTNITDTEAKKRDTGNMKKGEVEERKTSASSVKGAVIEVGSFSWVRHKVATS